MIISKIATLQFNLVAMHTYTQSCSEKVNSINLFQWDSQILLSLSLIKVVMRWLDTITDSMDMNLRKFSEIVKDRGGWCAAVHGVMKSWTWLSDWTAMITWLLKLRPLFHVFHLLKKNGNFTVIFFKIWCLWYYITSDIYFNHLCVSFCPSLSFCVNITISDKCWTSSLNINVLRWISLLACVIRGWVLCGH